MPGPMAPQGPPPPEGDPSQQGAPPAQDGQDQGGGMSQLLQHIDQAIDHVAQVVSQAHDAPPEAKQLIMTVDQAFGKFMDMVGGQAPEAEEPPGQGMAQNVPPEAGGNKGAIPHGM